MKKLILLYLAFLISSYYIFSQICGTPHPTNPTIYSGSASSRTSGSSELCIDVFFHIVRNTNGTSAFTLPNTDAIVSELNKFYSPHNIVINNSGSGFINNSNNLHVDIREGNSIAHLKNRSGVINYYIVDDMPYNGFALDIPSDALFIKDDRIYTPTSAHELGHCLGLYHTHKGLAHRERGCAEAIDGSNCDTCGDLVCDTPADNGKVNTNGYMPDLTNIMSYFHLFGYNRDHFTNGQGRRMRMALDNAPILSRVLSIKLSKVDKLCSTQSVTLSLSSLPSNLTTTWTVSSNITIVSSNNNSVTVRAKSSNATGNGWVKATLSNGVVLQEDFSVGAPDMMGYKLYNHSYNGNYTYLKHRVWNYLSIVYDTSVPDYYTTYSSPYHLKWEVTADHSLIRANPNRLPKAVISPRHPNEQGIVVGIRAENGCGYSWWKWQDFIVKEIAGGVVIINEGTTMEETEDGQ
ncbi:MAG: hypothetical protein GDA51_11785 [Ekhidna sp.]|nr:hypothetical protein [Ekhidna sp.]